MTAISVGKRIGVRFLLISYFQLGSLDVRKSLCYHNIPKSWMTPEAYQLSISVLTICPFDSQAQSSAHWADVARGRFPLSGSSYWVVTA